MSELRKCGDMSSNIFWISIGPINPVPSFFNSRERRFECRPNKFPWALICMAWYTVWSIIVIESGIHETTPDVSQTFNIVGATLAFILPLIAASAVNRNKEALNNYNAFCGDVLALGWEVLAYVRDETERKVVLSDRQKIQDLFEICLVLPTMVKWKFREGLDIEKVYLEKFNTKKEEIEFLKPDNINLMVNKKKQVSKQFIKTNIGGKFNYIYNKVEKDIDECDLLFALLNKIIADFETKGDTRKNMLQRTLERVYGSYGNMGNIQAYKLPQVYTVYLYISMFIFVTLFPLNYAPEGGELKAMNITTDGDFESLYAEEYSGVMKHGHNIIWHGIIVVYFLFGFNFMTSKVGNAFLSSKESAGFVTVGKSETQVNKSLLSLYKAKQDFQDTYDNLISRVGVWKSKRGGNMLNEMRNDTEAERKNSTGGEKRSIYVISGGESKETSRLLTNRRKLYV